jgi:hypothetical protein
MTRIITALMLSGLSLTVACHNKKKPETPAADPLPTEPVLPQTPQQPAPIRGPAP